MVAGLDANNMPEQYAVLGNPIKHSLSPEIHSLFAQQTGKKLIYRKLEAPLHGFKQYLEKLHADGYSGLNITVPFKTQAWELAEHKTERATVAGAVNTLTRTETGWQGDNTDGVGLVHDLIHQNIEIKDKHILILGAGGATRGVLLPLIREQPASLHIANRTAQKAIDLAAHFATFGSVTGSGLSDSIEHSYDVIINATAASLKGEIPDIPDNCLSVGGSCYDMFYSSSPTAFVNWGLQHTAAVSADGLGMLVEQAAASFYLWHGIKPDSTVVITTIRELLHGSIMVKNS